MYFSLSTGFFNSAFEKSPLFTFPRRINSIHLVPKQSFLLLFTFQSLRWRINLQTGLILSFLPSTVPFPSFLFPLHPFIFFTFDTNSSHIPASFTNPLQTSKRVISNTLLDSFLAPVCIWLRSKHVFEAKLMTCDQKHTSHCVNSFLGLQMIQWLFVVSHSEPMSPSRIFSTLGCVQSGNTSSQHFQLFYNLNLL